MAADLDSALRHTGQFITSQQQSLRQIAVRFLESSSRGLTAAQARELLICYRDTIRVQTALERLSVLEKNAVRSEQLAQLASLATESFDLLLSLLTNDTPATNDSGPSDHRDQDS